MSDGKCRRSRRQRLWAACMLTAPFAAIAAVGASAQGQTNLVTNEGFD